MGFIEEHTLLVITIALFIMFAILGYIVDKSKNKKNKEKEILTETTTTEFIPMEDQKETKKEENIQIQEDEKNINIEDLK